MITATLPAREEGREDLEIWRVVIVGAGGEGSECVDWMDWMDG